MTTRQCVIWTPAGRCLGNKAVDLPAYPPVCSSHMEQLFTPWIETRAREIAKDIAAKDRPPVLRRDAKLTDDDRAVLGLLRGDDGPARGGEP